MKKFISVVLVLLIVLSFAGCSANKFAGEWESDKIVTDTAEGTNTIIFSEFAAIAKLELTISIDKDGTYAMHYYVNGVEGEAYPQTGTYEIEDGVMIMSGGGRGELEGDELILYFDNDQVMQHYTKK